jgi:hypothetical protein
MMPMKYSDLISDSESKQAAEVEAKTQVVSDQATLAASEMAALEATQASDLADASLTAAVKLRPAGVLDPTTGKLYTVVDGELVVSTPVTADSDVPEPPASRAAKPGGK